MLSTERLVFCFPAGAVAFQQPRGRMATRKFCQGVFAAASRRAHLLPYANGSEDVTSTAGFATARLLKTNLYCPQEFWDFRSLRRCSLPAL